MIQVSYISRTSEPFSSEQLLDLLMQCRTNNTKSGVTGMLLYGNSTFLQAIEGEEAVIDQLVEKIWKDPRHAEIEILGRREIEQREYNDWSMGFEQVTEEGLPDVEGLKDFGASDFNFDYLVGHEPIVNLLMDHYRRPHWDPLISEVQTQDKVIGHLKDSLAQLKDRTHLARLALESLTQAARNGTPSEDLLSLCESTLESLRPH